MGGIADATVKIPTLDMSCAKPARVTVVSLLGNRQAGPDQIDNGKCCVKKEQQVIKQVIACALPPAIQR
jgi:hypothetical protein